MSWESVINAIFKDLVNAQKNQHHDNPHLIKAANEFVVILKKQKLFFMFLQIDKQCRPICLHCKIDGTNYMI